MKEQLALLGGPTTVTMRDEIAAAVKSPIIGEAEREAVLDAMSRSDIYSPTAEFEAEFAEYHGAKFALGHNNGTATLLAAYFAAGVEPGDEVICPAYTWHLAVSPILALHGIPVFCDVDPATGCISAEEIERRISPYTRAISILHPFGAVAPMDEIMAVAGKHGLPVIEDASHAHGAG
jgi:dTDP-4-amino-4,6-dideoxygalactose transaminase